MNGIVTFTAADLSAMNRILFNLSTEELIRIARLVTPASDLNRWVVTAENRIWARLEHDGFVSWNTGGATPYADLREDDESIREYVAEQLWTYNVRTIRALADVRRCH